MTASAPGLVSTDGAISLWKSVLQSLAHRLAPNTRDALQRGARCLEVSSTSLSVAAELRDLEQWFRAGHVRVIEATLSSLTDGAVALALIPVDDVTTLGGETAFTFTTFLTSPANAAALGRARLFGSDACEKNGGIAIHGPAGSGKTHLIRAIAAQLGERDPSTPALYRRAEQLSLDLVTAISTGEVDSFRDHLLGSSAFLLDDVEMLNGRQATQEELVRSLDLLEERGIPVAVALQKPPERSPGLIEALRLRLARLHAIEVRLPEWETRVAIVLARMRRWGLEPKPAIAALFASHLRGDLARLDVLLTRLMTQSSFSRSFDDIDSIKHLLTHSTATPNRVSSDDVLRAVAQQFNVRPRDLRSSSRSSRITTPRQIAMYLVRRHCGLSYPEIGRKFSRHHTTALHSDRVVQTQLGDNASVRAAVLLIEKELMRLAEDGG